MDAVIAYRFRAAFLDIYHIVVKRSWFRILHNIDGRTPIHWEVRDILYRNLYVSGRSADPQCKFR